MRFFCLCIFLWIVACRLSEVCSIGPSPPPACLCISSVWGQKLKDLTLSSNPRHTQLCTAVTLGCEVHSSRFSCYGLWFIACSEKRYDDNMDIMLECVRMSHSNAWSKDPMMQLKITALLSPELCVRLPNQSPQSLLLLVFRTDARGDFKLFFFFRVGG